MKRVYIAGPYTLGDIGANVAAAMDAAHRLMDAGFAPYVPHLSHFLHIQHQRPSEEWMALDFAWLACADILLRLPGKSTGADREVAHALAVGILVYTSEEQLMRDSSCRAR